MNVAMTTRMSDAPISAASRCLRRTRITNPSASTHRNAAWSSSAYRAPATVTFPYGCPRWRPSAMKIASPPKPALGATMPTKQPAAASCVKRCLLSRIPSAA